MPTTKQKKRQRQLLILLVVVVLGGGLIVLISQGIIFGESSDSAVDIEAAAQRSRQEISIPERFFTEKVLEEFTPYEPIKPPAEPGRENPFTPF
jgi:hypothetical protein